MNLKEIRELKKLDQTELDALAGLTRGTVNDIERGKNSNPSWAIVSSLSKALDVPPEELFPVDAV
jgi:transcriptional regulator with XRE-family HTH domain